MPVDFTAEPGIGSDIGGTASPPATATGVSGRSSDGLVVPENKVTFETQLLGTGGGRVSSGNNNLPVTPQQAYTPKRQAPTGPSNSGLQLVLDFRNPRQNTIDTERPGHVSPTNVAAAATSAPMSMLNSFAGSNTNLNKGLVNTVTAPFKSMVNAGTSAASGLSKAVQPQVQALGSAAAATANLAPIMFNKKSGLNLLKTMNKVYMYKSSSRLVSLLKRVGRT